MTFDITKNKNVFPYSYYIEICKIFGNKPQLVLMDFMKIYSIFCFDLSAQDSEESLGYQVTIHITKDTDFKAKCYCVIFEEKKTNILIQDAKMSNLI